MDIRHPFDRRPAIAGPRERSCDVRSIFRTIRRRLRRMRDRQRIELHGGRHVRVGPARLIVITRFEVHPFLIEGRRHRERLRGATVDHDANRISGKADYVGPRRSERDRPTV
jgi:hypothetical protein